MAIESKWVDAGWRSESRVIEPKYHAGIVATKSIVDLGHESWTPSPASSRFGSNGAYRRTALGVGLAGEGVAVVLVDVEP